jgi:hypothetical protein
MQSHQLNSQTLKPEIQAVLDIAEMQGVPVTYEHGLFMIKQVELVKSSTPEGEVSTSLRKSGGSLGTQNIDTILRWIETWKQWNKHETY